MGKTKTKRKDENNDAGREIQGKPPGEGGGGGEARVCASACAEGGDDSRHRLYAGAQDRGGAEGDERLGSVDHGEGSRQAAAARGDRVRRSERRSEGQQVQLHGGHLHGRRQRAARLKPHLKIRTETPSVFGRGYCCRPTSCAERFIAHGPLLFGCSWRIMCSVVKATERKTHEQELESQWRLPLCRADRADGRGRGEAPRRSRVRARTRKRGETRKPQRPPTCGLQASAPAGRAQG